MLQSKILLSAAISGLFLHHDLYAYLNYTLDTMYDTLGAYALAFAIETKVHYLFIGMLNTRPFWRNVMEGLIGWGSNCCNIWSTKDSGSTLVSIDASIDSYRASFVITILAIVSINLIISISWLISRFSIVISIFAALYIVFALATWLCLHHGFKNINTVRIQRCFLIAILASDYLNSII